MKKLFSTRLSDSAFSFAMLLLRLGFGGVMAFDHGLDKLMHFNAYVAKSHPMFGMGPTGVMSLLVFAEFFCSVFIVIGLFTRLAAIPLVIAMAVAFLKVHQMDYHAAGPDHPMGGQVALLFLIGFFVILIAGPGKISVDRSISKS